MGALETYQMAHVVKQRRCGVMTSHRRWYNVMMTHRRSCNVVLRLEQMDLDGRSLVFWVCDQSSFNPHHSATEAETLVACQNIDKQHRLRADCFWICRLIKVFPVCFIQVRTLVACQNIDKQHRLRSDCFWRSRLIKVYPVAIFKFEN